MAFTIHRQSDKHVDVQFTTPTDERDWRQFADALFPFFSATAAAQSGRILRISLEWLPQPQQFEIGDRVQLTADLKSTDGTFTVAEAGSQGTVIVANDHYNNVVLRFYGSGNQRRVPAALLEHQRN